MLPALTAMAAGALAWWQATRLDLDAPAEGMRQHQSGLSITTLAAIVACVVATTLVQLALLSH